MANVNIIDDKKIKIELSMDDAIAMIQQAARENR